MADEQRTGQNNNQPFAPRSIVSISPVDLSSEHLTSAVLLPTLNSSTQELLRQSRFRLKVQKTVIQMTMSMVAQW